jgi:ankyrin repeat protein
MNNHKNIENLIEHIVAGFRAMDLAKEFNGVDLNEPGRLGRTPLMAATAKGSLEMIEALVRSGASVQATGSKHMTALHEASVNGETRIAEYLISKGAEIDAATADGATPLMCAAAWGNIEVAKLLLEKGADRARKDRIGASARTLQSKKARTTWPT